MDHKINRITHCKAGVEYASVETKVDFTYSREGGHRYEAHEARPCFRHEHPLTNGCPKCRFPTSEEIKAHDDEMNGHIKKMFSARSAIVAELDRLQMKGGGGVMECPVCKGRLRYSRAASNGHIHARCSTEGCVSWME